jgi:hypothetical protein
MNPTNYPYNHWGLFLYIITARDRKILKIQYILHYRSKHNEMTSTHGGICIVTRNIEGVRGLGRSQQNKTNYLPSLRVRWCHVNERLIFVKTQHNVLMVFSSCVGVYVKGITLVLYFNWLIRLQTTLKKELSRAYSLQKRRNSIMSVFLIQ